MATKKVTAEVNGVTKTFTLDVPDKATTADIEDAIASYHDTGTPTVLSTDPNSASAHTIRPVGWGQRALTNLPDSIKTHLKDMFTSPMGNSPDTLTGPLTNPIITATDALSKFMSAPKDTITGAIGDDPIGALQTAMGFVQGGTHPNTRAFAGGAVKAGATSVPQNLGLKAGLSIPSALLGEVMGGPSTAAKAALVAGSLPILNDMFKGGVSAVKQRKAMEAFLKDIKEKAKTEKSGKPTSSAGRFDVNQYGPPPPPTNIP